MKKFFILVIVILAFFTVDHPLVKEPRKRLLGEGVGFLSSKTKVDRFPVATKTRNNINKQLALSKSEQDYVAKTFTTDESVKVFELRYCRQGDLNLYFYEEQLTTVCHIIKESLAQVRVK
ncbi:hypothetical protein [Pseudoalteromonas sp.]|uniref:hypothetical protein n=1 Tax=Pseudoalteromonas sp. TaxID=53249 RepID=UPI001BD0EA7E|nr:hypothetical protein [Pseudoalteromonas sp.]